MKTDDMAQKRELFLAELRVIPNVARACRIAGMIRRVAYERRESDPEFAEAWDEALAEGLDSIEGEVMRRAFEGVPDRPVFAPDGTRIEVTRYSDQLATVVLKAHNPRYKDQQRIDLGNADGKPFATEDGAAAARIAAILAAAQARRDAEDLV